MSSRPWYAFYPADYARDTAHLTMLEDGAYRRLMDHYYSSGNLLPTSVERLLRVCRARTEDEVAAVTFVLKEFFEETKEGYRHDRIEKELEIARNFTERAAKAGRASAQKRQLASNLSSTSVQLDGQLESNRSQSQSHKKDSLSLRDSEHRAKPKASRRALPENFPDDVSRKWAETKWLQKGRSDLCTLMGEEVSKFRDYHTANPKGSADWPASWRTWATNAMNFSKAKGNGHDRKPSAHDSFLAGGAAYLRSIGYDPDDAAGEGGTD